MMGRNRNAGKPGAKDPKKTLQRIAREVFLRYKDHCLGVVLCLVVSAVASVRGTLFMQRMIDDYILPMTAQENPDFGPLGWAIAGVAVFYALGAFSTWMQNYLMIFVSQGTLLSFRKKLFEKMERLPVSYFDTHAHGDIMSVYTNDIDTMRQMISQSMPQLLSSVITITSIVISMIILNVPLLLMTLFMVSVTMTLSMKRIKKAGGFFVQHQKDLGAVNGYIEEMMDGQKVVKIFCHEKESMEGFRALNEKLRASAESANSIAFTIMPLTMAMGNLSYVLCAVTGAALATSGYLGVTIGTGVFPHAEQKLQPAHQPGVPAVQLHHHGAGGCGARLPDDGRRAGGGRRIRSAGQREEKAGRQPGGVPGAHGHLGVEAHPS